LPELPEVEAVVRKLRPCLQDGVIRSVAVLRPRATHPQHPDELNAAAGLAVNAVERRGKNILIRLTQGLTLRIHLRMTGNVTVLPTHLLHSATARVVFALADGRGVAFEDPRMLGCVHLGTNEAIGDLLADLGVEPLSDDFTAAYLIEAARRSRKPVKLFLMDQHPVAGLGNIYSAESLFEARLHPARPASSISTRKLTDLHSAVREVLTRAITDAVASYSQPGSHQGMTWSVYSREGKPCVRCGRPIRRLQQGGRSAYYCPHCQR
jgi:formamidopyrimidine-DNA glycosylase